MKDKNESKKTKWKDFKPRDITRIYDREGISLHEKDKQAEFNLKQIKKRIFGNKQQYESQKLKTAKDFVEFNVTTANDGFRKSRLTKIKQQDDNKNRQESAKMRKS